MLRNTPPCSTVFRFDLVVLLRRRRRELKQTSREKNRILCGNRIICWYPTNVADGWREGRGFGPRLSAAAGRHGEAGIDSAHWLVKMYTSCWSRAAASRWTRAIHCLSGTQLSEKRPSSPRLLSYPNECFTRHVGITWWGRRRRGPFFPGVA